jgi:hypothetical protein
MGMTSIDAQEMLMEMGICITCNDHVPCGCETIILCEVCGMGNTLDEADKNDDKCFNCNSQL